MADKYYRNKCCCCFPMSVAIPLIGLFLTFDLVLCIRNAIYYSNWHTYEKPDDPKTEELGREDMLIAVIYLVIKLPQVYAPFPYFAFAFKAIEDSVRNRIHLRRVCLYVNAS